MKWLLLCLMLVGACADGDDDCVTPDAAVQRDAAAAAADAPFPDAGPPDAIPCGHLGQACCRIGDSCEPGLGCVAEVPGAGQCVALSDGAP